MTQAFNLSQLANNVNTSGQLNAAAGLYNQTPVANGGTGVASVAAGNILVGAGTAAMTPLAGASAGEVVTWSGTAWVSAAGSGGALQTYTVQTSPGIWTKTPTVKGIKVTVVGGGGNGGANPTPQTAGEAGGGGGGGTSIRLYPAPSLFGPQPYTVGSAGNTSSFGVSPAIVISATGGGAGQISAAPYLGGNGGLGSNGNLNFQGSAGSAGSASNAQVTPTGGSSFLGGASQSLYGVSGGNGVPGYLYGGGGGGSAKQSAPGAARTGGTGAQGVIIIEEFY